MSSEIEEQFSPSTPRSAPKDIGISRDYLFALLDQYAARFELPFILSSSKASKTRLGSVFETEFASDPDLYGLGLGLASRMVKAKTAPMTSVWYEPTAGYVGPGFIRLSVDADLDLVLEAPHVEMPPRAVHEVTIHASFFGRGAPSHERTLESASFLRRARYRVLEAVRWLRNSLGTH